MRWAFNIFLILGIIVILSSQVFANPIWVGAHYNNQGQYIPGYWMDSNHSKGNTFHSISQVPTPSWTRIEYSNPNGRLRINATIGAERVTERYQKRVIKGPSPSGEINSPFLN